MFRTTLLKKPPVVTVGEEDFTVLAADNAESSRPKAIQELRGADCLSTCYPPIQEKSLPKRDPLLDRRNDAAVDQYCIGKVMDVHRISEKRAAGYVAQLREKASHAKRPKNVPLNSLLVNECNNLKTLRRLVNHCKLK